MPTLFFDWLGMTLADSGPDYIKAKPVAEQRAGVRLPSNVIDLQAEGMGLEPTTGFPALEFQSSR
jgi:hypothetical protein